MSNLSGFILKMMVLLTEAHPPLPRGSVVQHPVGQRILFSTTTISIKFNVPANKNILRHCFIHSSGARYVFFCLMLVVLFFTLVQPPGQ